MINYRMPEEVQTEERPFPTGNQAFPREDPDGGPDGETGDQAHAKLGRVVAGDLLITKHWTSAKNNFKALHMDFQQELGDILNRIGQN